MTANRAGLFFMFALSLCGPISVHAATEIGERNPHSCPDRLPEVDIDLNAKNSGWVALSRRFPLSAVSFLYAPELTSTLKWSHYDSETETATWHFQSDEAEKWLGCNYGAVVLVKRIPDEVTQCTTTSRKDDFGHLEEVIVTCQ